MLNIGPQELLLIFVVALIVVGPHRLPALGRSIGRGLRELRKAQDEVKRTIQVGLGDEPVSGNGPRPIGSSSPQATPETKAADKVTEAAGEPSPPERAPTASEPLPESEVTEISRTLGQGLAELRRAKEEIRRSFRVDLGGTPRSTPTQPREGAGTTPDVNGSRSEDPPAG